MLTSNILMGGTVADAFGLRLLLIGLEGVLGVDNVPVIVVANKPDAHA